MCGANHQCWFPKVSRDSVSARSTAHGDIFIKGRMETLTFYAVVKIPFDLAVKKVSSDLPSPTRRGHHMSGSSLDVSSGDIFQ